MFLITLILSLFVFFKTIGYAIYEYTEQKNKVSGIVIIVLSFVALIAPCIVTFL